jgi:hypothetical protein
MANSFLILPLLLAAASEQTLIPMNREGIHIPHDFYPETGANVVVHLAGIGTIESSTTGQNRFGKRLRGADVRRFYQIHCLQAYDSIVIEKLSEWEYSIYPYRVQKGSK